MSSIERIFSETKYSFEENFSSIHRLKVPAIQPSDNGGVKIFSSFTINTFAIEDSQIRLKQFKITASSRLFFFANNRAITDGNALFDFKLENGSQLFFTSSKMPVTNPFSFNSIVSSSGKATMITLGILFSSS